MKAKDSKANNMKIFVALVLVCTLLFKVDALKCYTCSMGGDDKDQTCLENPEKAHGTAITNCNKKYCIIIRQEYKDTNGKIVSFLRGCDDNPLFHNTEVEDATYLAYYRSCTTDLCNKGDGIHWSDGAASADGYVGENLLVPGVRNNALKLTTSILTMIMALIYLYVS